MVVAVVIVVLVVIVVIVGFFVSRRRADPVDSFRRQIDALSPEARRPTISQAHGPAEPADAEPAGEADGQDGPGEPEGGRGAPPDDDGSPGRTGAPDGT